MNRLWLENLFEVDGPNLFTDGDNHEAKCWRQRASHRAASALSDTTVAQRKGLHIQCCFYEGWYIFDHDLSCDFESTKRASFDEVSRVVGFSRIDREDLIVSHAHMRSQEIQQHVLGPDEPCLVDAGEEASQVLVDEDEVSINRAFSQDGRESVDITRGEVLRAGHRNELEDRSGQDVEHRPKRGVHKGYDGTATLERFFLFWPECSQQGVGNLCLWDCFCNVETRELTIIEGS